MERTLLKFVQVLKITFTSNHWESSTTATQYFFPSFITSSSSVSSVHHRLHSFLWQKTYKKLEATKRNRWTHWKDELLEKNFTKKKIGLRKETKKIRDLITQWTSKSWWVKTYYTSALLPFLPFFVSLSLFFSLSSSLSLPFFLSSSLPFLDTRFSKEWGNRK